MLAKIKKWWNGEPYNSVQWCHDHCMLKPCKYCAEIEEMYNASDYERQLPVDVVPPGTREWTIRCEVEGQYWVYGTRIQPGEVVTVRETKVEYL